MSEAEIEDAKKRFDFLKRLKPESVTMEKSQLGYYMKFLYTNITVCERLLRIASNGELQAINSPTLIFPNDVEIQDGKINPKQKSVIEKQEHVGVYLKKLQDKMNLVERRYLKRKAELDYDD